MTLGEILSVAGAVIAPVATVLTIYVNRLRERDKLEYDAELKLLRDKATRCDSDYKSACETAARDRERREQAELKAARIEGELASAKRELKDVRSENRELRDIIKDRDESLDQQ